MSLYGEHRGNRTLDVGSKSEVCPHFFTFSIEFSVVKCYNGKEINMKGGVIA